MTACITVLSSHNQLILDIIIKVPRNFATQFANISDGMYYVSWNVLHTKLLDKNQRFYLQAENIGKNPLFLMMNIGFSVQCAFMLPVSNPPNAVAFATGKLKVMDMVSFGIDEWTWTILFKSYICNTLKALEHSLTRLIYNNENFKWEWRCSWSSTDRRCCNYMSMVSFEKGPNHHAYAWQIGPFCQGTLNVSD